MVSVGMSKLGCTHLIFVDPGVKINGYYREVFLSQHFVTCRQVSGDSCSNKTVHQCTGMQDNQAAATGDAYIHLT